MFLQKSIRILHASRRYLISESLKANDLWESRLKNPVFKILQIKDLNVQLAQRLASKQEIPALDYDILANRLHEMDVTNLDFFESSIIKSFNKTQESLTRLPMTSHAIIRAYLQLHEENRLLPLLQDRINFGIFLDSFSAYLLIDKFLDQNDLPRAAAVCYEVMRQEEFTLTLTNLLTIKTCIHHWKSSGASLQTSATNSEEQQQQEGEEEDEYIIEKYIRNPHYDDHFYIVEERLLLGKTLHRVGAALSCQETHSSIHADVNSSAVRATCQLLGLALYEKFDDLIEFALKQCENVPLPGDLRETLLSLFDSATRLPEGETWQQGDVPRYSQAQIDHLKAEFEKIAFTTTDTDIVTMVDKWFVDNLPRIEMETKLAIENQYNLFQNQREKMVDHLQNSHQRIKLIRQAKLQLRELLDREELLTYQDNVKKITYDAWQAPRTIKERRLTKKTIIEKDLANVKATKKRSKVKLGIIEE